MDGGHDLVDRLGHRDAVLLRPVAVAEGHRALGHVVVARGELVYAILNLYPYNSGHVLVCPYRHVADYTDLTVAETAEFAEFTQRSLHALRQASAPQGFNIGINLGSVAGAGIAAHLHQHVVPRWGGDTNFMPVVGRTRVLPQLLADTRKILADAWP